MSRTRFFVFFSFAILVSVVYISCKKTKTYPPEPFLEFVSFTKIQNTAGADATGILKVRFTDGDGDVGLSEQDTLAPFNKEGEYFYNFFITYFEKQKGVYQEIDLKPSNNSRVPLLNPDEEDKGLEGDIEIELFINNPFSVYDTIRFDAYLVDRALNRSNTITTGDIIIKK